MILRSIKFKICHLYKNDINYFIDSLKIHNYERKPSYEKIYRLLSDNDPACRYAG